MLSFLDNWRLPKKMLAAFTLLGIILCAVGVNGYITASRINDKAQSLYEQGLTRAITIAEIQAKAITARTIALRGYIEKNDADAAALRKTLEEGQQSMNAATEKLRQLSSDEMLPEIEAMERQMKETYELNQYLFTLRANHDMETYHAEINVNGRAPKANLALIARLDALFDASVARSKRIADEGSEQAAFGMTTSIILIIVGFTGIVVTWFAINRSVAVPLGRITTVTQTLANGGKADIPYRDRHDEVGDIAEALEKFREAGDARAEADARAAAEQRIVTSSLRDSLSAMTEGNLNQTIDAEFPPAYVELKTNFNAALASLRELIGAVVESSVTIRTGSGEIAQASEDLARRTESNAASLEETSAAIAQMDERLRATATAAGETVQRADGAMAVVGSGRSIADEAVEAMGRVSESAKGIDSVIEGLDKIAFQTRVLAMNAAVEAGRAGDAGRGFAVVADLVSALAMRSEEEAKRAREQLTATQTDIGTAVEAVQKVDSALQDISSDVSEVHSLLSEIASDNQAQSSTVTQISAAISTMDQATQENAAMVEETSAASRNLSSEATALADRAGMFNIGNGRGPSASSAKSKPNSFAPANSTPPKSMSKMTSPNDWLDF